MKKSHPVRRVVLTTAATVSGIVLLLTLKPASDPAGASAAGGAVPPAAARSPQGVAQPAGSGTVTGGAAQTQYGPVQVRLTVSDGKITKAEAVRAPEGGRSSQITERAVPQLNRRAVAAQSAGIDAVSGATYTSAGYRKSLQSALDQVAAEAGGGAARESGAPDPPRTPEETPEESGAPEGGGSGGGGTAGGGGASDGGSGDGGGASSGADAQARTITGEAVRTRYGPVQVRITLSGGKITRAVAVQAPQGGRSDRITNNAVPRLNMAAVAAGSADIDAVSGATYTSAGYKESLQSALDRAGG
ncbi:FMN-binding protein [Streptomyces sp. DH24]|uniref:FMN-binding protein n=1 Tax=Streptomyces sp. DH24 TaxID=3040123 RepID=UPI00244370EF|nr:FMN-binding protein [Streptomyces sp. DH24]MDG9718270.1 FMN-binding protein [Streptomyces sp. DH24]